MRNSNPIAIEVCVSCLMAQESDETVEPYDATPWELIDSLEPTPVVTAGWLDSEYESRGETPPDYDAGEDDYTEFSWSPCDACGSTLGGSRYPYTLWVE